jgi:hypothetical protein
MRTRTLIAVIAVTAAATALPTLAHAAGEPYAWSISASSTDPFVQTAGPLSEPGSFSVWLWFVCHEADAVAAAEFQVTVGGNLFFAGFHPDNPSIKNFGSASGELRLAIGGCPVPPLRVGRIDVADFGGGGTLCLGPSAGNGINVSVDCSFPQPQSFPNGVFGFSSDGSPPCVIGDCVDSGTGVGEPNIKMSPWGRVKGGYR